MHILPFHFGNILSFIISSVKSIYIVFTTFYIYNSDNHYYEKFEDGTTKDITEEVPFEIPNSWKWIHFGELFYTQSGLSYKKDNLVIKSNSMFTIFRGGNIGDGEYFYKGDDLQISEQFVRENTILKKNCYITPSVTSIEHIGKLALIDRNLDKTVAGGFVLIIYPMLENDDLLKYFLFALSSKYHKDNCKKITNKSGQAFYNLSREKLMQLIIPLPPLEEQSRIAEKISQFLPYINNYDSIYSKIEALNSNYKNELKKSILQYAIQGKLVKQNPNDEPADKLIESILEEKQQLMKDKKIKKENLSIIYKDTDNQFYEKFGDGTVVNVTEEIPFDIPDSWCWARMKSICSINPRNSLDDNLEFSFIPMSLIDGGYNNSHTFEIKKWKDIKSGFSHFKENDIGLAKITPCFQNRKSVIFKNLKNGYGAGTTELHILRPLTKDVLNEYILWFIKSSYFIDNGVKTYSGTAGQQRINKDFIPNFLVPIPNKNEQGRIIEKIKKLFDCIETAE